MSKRTTVKPIELGYRPVGSAANVEYTKVMGVLKGLTVGQDDPESTSIDAEFYDFPFDIFYDGNPVTLNFELANYDLAELDDLFGGTSTAASVSEEDTFEAPTATEPKEYEWKLSFQRGNGALVIYRGLTIGTLKKDADGALNSNITITSLLWTDTTQTPAVDHLYKIVGKKNA